MGSETPEMDNGGSAAQCAPDAWDVLHSTSDPSQFWTTTNVGEAAPGVQTPLSVTTWQPAVSAGVNEAGRAIGVFTPTNGFDGSVLLPFYGRASMSVNFLRLFGERMPGANAEQVVSGFIGHIPDTMTFSPTRRFYINVLRRYPVSFARLPGMLVATADRQDAWWRDFIRRIATAGSSEAEARRLFREATARHYEATVMQCVGVFAAVQPVHDVLVRTIEKLEGDVSRLTAPIGGAETRVVADLWGASRGMISIEGFLSRHGFHGPLEGELSSQVWRENDTPVRRMVEQYAQRADDETPRAREAQAREARAGAAAALLASVPRSQRPAIRALLAVGLKRLPLRGVAKRAMVQGFDGVRAAARHLGEILASDGRLPEPEAVFYLTVAELTGPLPIDAQELVTRRRERRELYRHLQVPGDWAGVPPRQAIRTASDDRNANRIVTGVGVSAGILEGTARVVDDPGFAEVEPDEILVARTTDPSWASIMFISAGLIVDIGGALSHAAVVARELGIPCVVNTGNGTSRIRTGDRVRIDGNAGTVEILSAASETSPTTVS